MNSVQDIQIQIHTERSNNNTILIRQESIDNTNALIQRLTEESSGNFDTAGFGVLAAVTRQSVDSQRTQQINDIIIAIIDLVSCGDHEELQRFLENVVIDLTKVYDDRGFNLIHLASLNSDHKTLDVLIYKAFDYWDNLNMEDRTQSLSLLKQWVNEPSRPPLKIRTSSFLGSRTHSSEIVMNVDNSIIVPKAEQEDDGSRPIHFAAFHENSQLIDILLNSGADPTLANKKNLNVLHMAAQGDRPYSLMVFNKCFESLRLDVNTEDSEGSTPLHWACFCNSHKIINFLIALGANVNARDVNDQTPLHIALKKFNWRDTRKSFITI